MKRNFKCGLAIQTYLQNIVKYNNDVLQKQKNPTIIIICNIIIFFEILNIIIL